MMTDAEEQQKCLRSSLRHRLLDAVKQCQGKFACRKELATDADIRVSCVLSQIEAVLYHGLKGSSGLSGASALRSVSDMLAPSATESASATALWTFLCHHMSAPEIDRFMRLKQVATDAGRVAAWLRSSLNEKTLPRYVEAILGSGDLLERFYEPWAFLRDAESTAIVPQMAAGLQSVLFALDIDSSQLDLSHRSTGVIANFWGEPPTKTPPYTYDLNRHGIQETSDLLLEAKKAPQPILNVKSTATAQHSKNKEKRRSPLVNYVSFGEGDSLPGGTGGRMHLVKKIERCPRTNAVQSWDGVLASSLEGDGVLASPREEPDQGDFPAVFLDSTSSASPDMATAADADVASSNVATTACQDVATVASSPDATEDDTEQPSVSSHTLEESSTADNCVRNVLVQDMATLEASDLDIFVPGVCYDQSTSSFASEDGSSAVDAFAEDVGGDCSSTRGRSLRDKLEQQAIRIQELEEQLQHAHMKHTETLDLCALEKANVQKENDLLKSQVEQYASALQMLRAKSGDSSIDSSKDDDAPKSDLPANADDAEKKLVQVAEMHADLIEFNQRLMTDLERKSRLVRKLRNELIVLRGPLPSSYMDDESPTPDSSGGDGTHAACDTGLVNLWVPTTFVTGKPPDIHDVYQIYIRLRNTEWNVYKRYSQIYAFHKSLCKKDPAVGSFLFPPKKSMGHRDKKFVEERRRRLECYLRRAVGHAVQTFPEFKSLALTKQSIVNVMPFFNEYPNDGRS